MKSKAKEKLRAFWELFHENDHVLIVINADPDSMASAMAVKRLLWRRTASVSISNSNVVGRPDNIAMVRLLDVKMVHIEKIDGNLFNRFVIVDSQPDHNELFSKFRYDAIIDHHPLSFTDVPFHDIRPNYGATSSILTEYIQAAGIKPSAKLSTGLFHGIKIDTHNFERNTVVEDMNAFQFVFKHANINLARKIEQSEIRFDQLKYYKKALTRKIMQKGKLFAHMGVIENPDTCVHLADFFMRVESVEWSIVSGIYNKTLIIIFRSDGKRKDAGKVSMACFGSFGNAGGHKSAARAEIPVSVLRNTVKPYKSSTLTRWIIKKFKEKALLKKYKGQ